MRSFTLLLAIGLLTSAGCHPGPVIGPNQSVGGTIAGIVSTDMRAAVPDRKVTAVNAQTGARHDVMTGANGGYTIKVPAGTYRLEVELRPGESVSTQPGETRINKSDLDAHRNFVITAGRQ